MPSRTQLHVNINPELLKSLKQNAIKSGMTLTEYVSQIIRNYISNDNIPDEVDLIEKRIESIENQLKSINNKLNQANINSTINILDNSVNGFSKEGAVTFAKSVTQLFREECKKRKLSTEEAVIELTPHIQSTFNFKYWGTVIEMFSEGDIKINPENLMGIYKEHNNSCPFTDTLYKWCGKNSEKVLRAFNEAIIR